MSSNKHPSFPVFIVDDEKSILSSLKAILRLGGIDNVITFNDSREVTAALGEQETAVVLLDLTMPHMGGSKLLPLIKENHPEVTVIIVTGDAELSTAVECMKNGAFDYLVKPVESSKLIATVKRAVEIHELRIENRTLKDHLVSNELKNPRAFSHIITKSEKMRSVLLYAEAISRTAQTVLITGETGVGKELIAEAIHKASGRSGELVAVNVAGFDDNMFSDTLFGHKKGAFTGAEEPRKGLIETARGGTLFLDEIGDLNQTSQIKLLRLLESGEYMQLGSDSKKTSQARTIVATNRDLATAMEKGEFRKDLYYRLRMHHVYIPPLRERKEDIPPLADFFLEAAAEEYGAAKPLVPAELPILLSTYHYPGNVRELKAIIYDGFSRSGILSETGTGKSVQLPLEPFRRALGGEQPELPAVSSDAPVVFTERLPTIKEATDLLIREALERAEGKQTIAARILGISQQALSKRLRKE